MFPKMIDLVSLSFRNLGRKKSRSMLMILGITIGVASVVLIASIGEIGRSAVDQELSAMGTSGVMISGNSKTAGARLTTDHLEAIRQSGVSDSAIPIVVDYTKSYMRGLMLDTIVWGIDSGANQVIALEAIHGRLITRNDVQAGRNVCVVDQNIARAYYKRDNIVGKTLTLQFAGGSEEFEIVGVAESGGNLMQGLMGDIFPSFLYLPYTTMQNLSGKDSFDQIAVRIRDGVDEDVAGSQLVSVCKRISGIQNGFRAENMQAQKEKLDGVFQIVTVALSAIAGVSLVVAGLSIMTVMLQSLGERTREIGIKKAIGAGRKEILLEFLIEAFTVSAIGSLSGSAVGVILIFLGCLPFGTAARFNFEMIGICIAVSTLVGVVFGVYPAAVASRLRPVDALRCE